MEDLAYYKKTSKELPVVAFTPDGGYPLCHGEKGIMDFTLDIPAEGSNIVEFVGGVAHNVVPDHAELVLSGVIRHTQLLRVKELPHIPADFPGVIFTGHTTMTVNTAARGRQLMLRLLAGFPAYINLHGGKIRPRQGDCIASAGGADVRTVRFCHADGSVLTGIRPR